MHVAAGTRRANPRNSNETGKRCRQLQGKMKDTQACFVTKREDRVRIDNSLPLHKYHTKQENNYLCISSKRQKKKTLICNRDFVWELRITLRLVRPLQRGSVTKGQLSCPWSRSHLWRLKSAGIHPAQIPQRSFITTLTQGPLRVHKTVAAA